MISDDIIKGVLRKFDNLHKLDPDIVEEVSEEGLREVIDYLTEPEAPEYYVWEQISVGNIYSYAAYIHEKTEVEFLDDLIQRRIVNSWADARNQDRRKHYLKIAHGKALFEQYKVLQRYLHKKTGKYYRLTQLCFCDVWNDEEYDRFDKKNAKRLKKYLKKYEPIWYNNFKEQSYHIDFELKLILDQIRMKGHL